MNPVAVQAVSIYPPPPEYAQNYTTERMLSGQVLPPPPMHYEYTAFGEEYKLDEEVVRSLSSQGIKQLYSNKQDWKTEMKKLNKSVVVAFLDLLDILINCPDSPERVDKANDIQTLLINMHHLINEFRPLQARDTLCLMQQAQVADLEDTVVTLKAHIEDGKAALREELKVDRSKLLPVPRPTPACGIMFDSDEESDMPKLEPEISLESKKDLLTRRKTRPTKEDLRARQKAELKMLASYDF